MIDYFKKRAINNRADDTLLYEYVLNEMEQEAPVKGLWAKALAHSNGDHANAESLYMQYRVQSIKDVLTAQDIAYRELTKPNLFQYIQEIILPDTLEFSTTKDITPNREISHSVTKEEEAIYDEVASELTKGIKKEGLWLKALENANGDETKAKALYIKYRSKSIMDEREAKKQALEAKKQALKEQEIKKQKIIEKEDKNASGLFAAIYFGSLPLALVILAIMSHLGLLK